MTAWQMYLLTRLDPISSAFEIASVFSIVTTILFCVIGGIFVGDRIIEKTTYEAWVKRCLILIGIVTPVSLALPTSKQMAAIIIVPKIVNNAKVQEVPDKLMTLATEWLEELRPGKSKEDK